MATASRLIPLTNFLAKPVDMGKSFRGIRIFGDNKTWRGVIFGTLTGTIVAFLQFEIYKSSTSNDPLSYTQYITHFNLDNFAFFGFLIALGALMGDMIKSFFKRRVGIKPGSPFFPFDQLDYIAGSTLFSLIIIQFKDEVYFAYFVIYFILHLVVKYIGFLIGVDKSGF
jgi:CDP-2,3-bis-(O-geranylgeranyl)-sn-glycerol synthase